MQKKIKLLQISPQFPFPEDDGGKIGIANILKEFSRSGIDVTFFCLSEKMPDVELIKYANEYADIRICIHSTRNSAIRILNSVILNHSIYIKKHISKQIKSELFKILKEKQFDAIHADHSCMAPLGIIAKKVQSIPLGIRLHNIEWTIWQRYAEALPLYSPKRFYIEQQSYELKRAERFLYSQADMLFPITSPDKDRALELSPNSRALIAGAGVNIDEWKPEPSFERNAKELVLATTYKWIHNVNAVRWFVHEVLPLVQKIIPDIKLTLIGKDAPEWLKRFSPLGVNCIGYVEKVQPYYNRASLNISPLFVGGGIRIKILEAMAMELPVIASPIAAEGINANESQGLFLAKNKEEFADLIIRLVMDTHLARKLGKSARKFIIDNYTWERNVAVMADYYKKLI